VLLKATEAVAKQVSIATNVVPVKALSVLNSFWLGFDNYGYDSCSKDL
jgi:hypothetical protein